MTEAGRGPGQPRAHGEPTRGLHEATAKWMHQGGGNWSRYAAQLARGHPHQP